MGMREARSPQRIVAAIHGTDLLNDEANHEALERRGLCRLSCVDSPYFDVLSGSVIACNLMVSGFETDIRWEGWVIFENLFLAFFIIEVTLRWAWKGDKFFVGEDRCWSIFDVVIVALGTLDLWVVPLIFSATGYHSTQSNKSTLLRCLRLLRLLRLFRMFKMFKALMSFLNALSAMFSPLVNIFTVLFLFCYLVAIVLTQLLGHGHAFEDQAKKSSSYESVQNNFRDVPTSLFTLFKIITMDNWHMIAEPIVEIDGRWRLFFVVFIVFASWVMISLLTAVASDKMLQATSDRREREDKEREQKKAEFINFLRDCFYEADADGNGLLDREEFKDLLEEESVHLIMQRLGVTTSKDELLESFDMLDVDGSGELNIDEFVAGLSFLREDIASKHVVSVHYTLKTFQLKMGERMDALMQHQDLLLDENETILKYLKASVPQNEWSYPQQWLAQAQYGGAHAQYGAVNGGLTANMAAGIFPSSPLPAEGQWWKSNAMQTSASMISSQPGQQGSPSTDADGL